MNPILSHNETDGDSPDTASRTGIKELLRAVDQAGNSTAAVRKELGNEKKSSKLRHCRRAAFILAPGDVFRHRARIKNPAEAGLSHCIVVGSTKLPLGLLTRLARLLVALLLAALARFLGLLAGLLLVAALLLAALLATLILLAALVRIIH